MTLKLVKDFWFPETETHMSEFIIRQGSYQSQHRKNALSHVSNFGVCVEIGGHIGTWGRDFGMVFKQLHVFEPMEDFRACYEKNVVENDWVTAEVIIHPYALGDKNGRIVMKVELENTGHSHIDYVTDVPGSHEMRTLDSFELPQIDFIKCDVEGAEEFVMMGAKETILRCKPIICIEQKAQKHIEGVEGYHGQYGAVEYLKTLGMKQLSRVVDDVVMGW